MTQSPRGSGHQVLRIGPVPIGLRRDDTELASRIFARNLAGFSSAGFGAHPGKHGASWEEWLSELKGQGFAHLTLKIDSREREAVENLRRLIGPPIAVMEQFRFQSKRSLRPVKLLCQVGPLEPPQIPRILEIAQTAFRANRFYKDTFFSKPDCDRFYQELIKTYVSGKEPGGVLVGTRGENVIGFLAWREWAQAASGKSSKLWGAGLGAVAPGSGGCYPGIVRTLIAQAQASGVEWAEFDSQSDNPQVRRIWNYFGMEKVKETAVFHQALV